MLATKLNRALLPPRRVHRPHILQRLNEGLDAKRQITLVSAPAGFGKTVCVCEWLDVLPGWPVSWLSLDPADDDPGRFLTYFVAALQKVDTNIGREIMPVLKAGNLPPQEIIGATLINDLLAVEEPFLFVLDDFHVIQDELIMMVMDMLIDNLPETFHLVLLTREDPALPLARLRANNQLTEIRAANLRFTADEANEYLTVVLGLELCEHDAAALTERTEGWIAGLHLAGLSIRDRADPSGFITTLSGSHRFILSYLTDEVLSRQPEDIQQFLLQTSILERLNGDLCDAVAGRTGSHALLELLLHANLFLIPLDDEGLWYRYHQLFADLLRDRLSVLMKEKAPELHRRASRWYSQAGMIEKAIHHALAADDYTTAVNLIESHAMDMLMQWHLKTVEGWMQSIPLEWIATSPQANLAFAWMHLMSGTHIKAAPFLERLGSLLADPQSGAEILKRDPVLEAKWLALQAMLLNAQGKQVESLNLCRRALEIIPPADSLTSLDIRANTQVRSMIYLGFANAYQQMGDYQGAVDAYQTLIKLGQRAGNSVIELLGISGLALLALQHGQYYFAFKIITKGIERIERTGVLPPISTALYGELGVIHYQWHQLEKAHDNFQRAIQVGALSGFSDAELYYGVILSRLYQIQGDLETAFEKIEQAVELMQVEAPAAVREEVLAQQVRIYLALDDLGAAERVLEGQGFSFGNGIEFPESESEHGVPFFTRDDLPLPMWLLTISAVRVLLYRAKNKGERENLKPGVSVTNQLVENALQSGIVPYALETLLVRAQLHTILGNEDASRADYLAALDLGQQEDLISVFLEEGPAVYNAFTKLLEKNQFQAIKPGYVEKILAAFPVDIIPDYVSEVEECPQDGLIEPLSRRELEILGLIEEGLSNQEIAERLVITLHTVKKHSSNIYSKLGVSSRTQAVARARQLELLSHSIDSPEKGF